MEPNHINSFLEKFRKIFYQKENLENLIFETIEKETKIKINKDAFMLKNNSIYLKTSPLIKNEIFLKKEKILLAINEESKQKILDIK